MKIYTNNENGILTISLEGRLDTATSPELEALLKEKMDDADAIIFDFESATLTGLYKRRIRPEFIKPLARLNGINTVGSIVLTTSLGTFI